MFWSCGSLADMTAIHPGWQGSLLDVDDEPTVGPLGPFVDRHVLGDGAWLDVRPGWLGGADSLFDRLYERVPWRGEQRRMYDRTVAVPRLLAFYEEDQALPDPGLLTRRAQRLITTTAPNSVNRSARPGCACTATDATAWPGTAIASGAAPRTTRWSRSCHSVRPELCCYGRATEVVVAPPTATTSATATWWSWAAVASGRGNTPCRRRPDRPGHVSASSFVPAASGELAGGAAD
jgi:hypothetical protein